MFDFSCVEQTIIAFCVGVILCKLFRTDIDFFNIHSCCISVILLP